MELNFKIEKLVIWVSFFLRHVWGAFVLKFQVPTFLVTHTLPPALLAEISLFAQAGVVAAYIRKVTSFDIHAL